MCGRYGLAVKPEDLQDLFGLADLDPRLVPPRHNIAPTQPIVVVRQGRAGRELAPMRWGLIPGWVKDPNQFPLLINARGEGIAERASFRNAMRHRRCLVPASGFYEWRAGPGKSKQPYWIRPPDGGAVAFAGLWETWRDADGGEIDTAAIVTTDASERLKPIHPRMPAVLAADDWAAWLSPETPPADAAALLRPAPEDALVAFPVSRQVNAVANDDPGLQEPVEPDAGEEAGEPGADEAKGQPRLL